MVSHAFSYRLIQCWIDVELEDFVVIFVVAFV